MSLLFEIFDSIFAVPKTKYFRSIRKSVKLNENSKFYGWSVKVGKNGKVFNFSSHKHLIVAPLPPTNDLRRLIASGKAFDNNGVILRMTVKRRCNLIHWVQIAIGLQSGKWKLRCTLYTSRNGNNFLFKGFWSKNFQLFYRIFTVKFFSPRIHLAERKTEYSVVVQKVASKVFSMNFTSNGEYVNDPSVHLSQI